MSAARTDLERQGACYPGPDRSHHEYTRWAINPKPANRRGPHVKDFWEWLCAEVRAHPTERVAVSSEMLDLATPEQAASIVDELGGDRVHVVVTLRPLAVMLSSIWQQGIHGRGTAPYGEWLEAIFGSGEPDEATAKFWHQHQHDELVRRWMNVVGPERTHVVVVDRSSPYVLYRAFERLLDLDEGTLTSQETAPNRSLTAIEVELLRQINMLTAEHGIKGAQYRSFVREGVNMAFKRGRPTAAGDLRIGTPQWALDAAHERSEAIVANLHDMGVNIIGSLDELCSRPSPAADAVLPETLNEIPVSLAALAVVGSIQGSGTDSDRAKARQRARQLGIVSPDGPPQTVAPPARRRVIRGIKRRLGIR